MFRGRGILRGFRHYPCWNSGLSLNRLHSSKDGHVGLCWIFICQNILFRFKNKYVTLFFFIANFHLFCFSTHPLIAFPLTEIHFTYLYEMTSLM